MGENIQSSLIHLPLLIISVGEARKILGVDAMGRSDDEIARDIMELTDLAQKLLNTSILPNKII